MDDCARCDEKDSEIEDLRAELDDAQTRLAGLEVEVADLEAAIYDLETHDTRPNRRVVVIYPTDGGGEVTGESYPLTETEAERLAAYWSATGYETRVIRC